MAVEETSRLVDHMAQEVIDRIALRERVDALAELALERMMRRHGNGGQRRISRDAAPSQTSPPKKLVLRSKLSPGDILMLTAAVRDLHLTYPNQFITDVRTPCPHLWENN